MAVGWCEPVEAGLKTQRGAGFGSCSLRFEVGCLWLTVPADVVMPGVVGRAHTPSLARERDDERLRALCAEGAGEPEAEQHAREMPTKLLFDIEIGKPIVRAPRSVPRGLSARVFRACAVESGLDHSYEILNSCLVAESSLEESS